MKLEHKNQELISMPRFLQRMMRYTLFASLLIVLSVLIGMIGYYTIADCTWIDSFHMACLILTGMGPAVEMQTNAAKIFSSLYALYSGVAFLTISGVFFAPIIHRILHILQVDAE
jgi:hypothetical protein